MLFDNLSLWMVIGVLFFVGFAIIVVTAFFTRPPPAQRKNPRRRD